MLLFCRTSHLLGISYAVATLATLMRKMKNLSKKMLAVSGLVASAPNSTKTNPKCYSKPVSCGLCTFLLAIGLLTMPATARCGLIFVGNRNNDAPGAGTIGEYTTSGATVNPALVSGLSEPVSLAVSGGNLFVLNSFTGTVGKYTTSGAVVNPALVSVNLPNSIAVSAGNLFVSGGTFGSGTIGVYNATTGAPVNPTLVSGLNDAFGIAVSGGNLFVADTVNGTIGEYNATTGAPVNPALVSGLNFPESIEVSGGNLFVTEIGGTIGKYNATTGAPVDPALISGLPVLGEIAVFGGNLFVTQINTGTIGEYNPTTGAPVNPALVSGLNLPNGLAVVTVAETSSTGTLLLLGLAAMLGLKLMLRQPARPDRL